VAKVNFGKTYLHMRNPKLLRAITIFIVFAFSSLSVFAQNRIISGIVSDQAGTLLANATVSIKGEKTSTLTDINGAFKITVTSPNARLLISYVGGKQIEVSTAGKSTLAVTIEVAEVKLSEVVVIGYGKSSRANLTTAQSSISTKDIEKTVNTTVEQAIQGRVAGVYITQNSGQPGGGISVAIRGTSSINGNTEPLYVIDGVQVQGGGTANSSNPLAGLNPNDIEDMQILQGPSATAIYGSRATNGVVLVTTKRGKNGDFKINYNVQYNIQTPPKRVSVMTLPQYAQMQKEYKAIAGGTVREELLDPSILGPGTDWQAELFNNAAMQKHQLSLSGGSNNTTFYMSGEYLDQQGVAEGSGFKRYGFRMNLDNKPREWINIGANLSFNQTNENMGWWRPHQSGTSIFTCKPDSYFPVSYQHKYPQTIFRRIESWIKFSKRSCCQNFIQYNFRFWKFHILSTNLFNWMGCESYCFFNKWYKSKHLLELEPVSRVHQGNWKTYYRSDGKS
jgi:TonB-linked SusC/RagA family outer membrane protein